VQVENAKDIEALIATFAHPRYEFIAEGEDLVADGAGAVRQFWRDEYTAFPDFRAEVLSMRQVDDAVILEV
jgi:SnoaL-like domain